MILDPSEFLDDLNAVIKKSIDQNFMDEGRFGNGAFGGGNTRWEQSQRAKKQGGQTLNDDGHLAGSIRVSSKIIQNGVIDLVDGKLVAQNPVIEVEMGSNMPYATIHQFGGVISRQASSKVLNFKTHKSGKHKGKTLFAKEKKATRSQKVSVGAYSITIPRRPYLVLQDADIIMIAQKYSSWLAGKLS